MDARTGETQGWLACGMMRAVYAATRANTMTRRQVATYLTEDDEGNKETVIEWETVITFRPVSGESASSHTGQRDWTLPDGSGVNYVDEDTFQVVETDKILRKI